MGGKQSSWSLDDPFAGSVTDFTSISTEVVDRCMPNSADVFFWAVEGAVEGFILRAIVLNGAA